MKTRIISFILFFFTVQIWGGCRKLIEIEPPTNTITTDKVFEEDEQAKSAMAGLYYNMVNTAGWISGTDLVKYTGLSSDELVPFNMTDPEIVSYFNNELRPDNGSIRSLWKNTYSMIYVCNAMIENLESASSGVSLHIKQRLIAEAKFVRAFSYFNLVNLFGPLPLVLTTNWQKSNLLPRSSAETIYTAIISDLMESTNHLPDNFEASSGERILPTRWAASALLLKVYVYTQKWSEAISTANALLNDNPLFKLEPLDNVFGIKSGEAIWQLKQEPLSTNQFPSPYGTLFLPSTRNSTIAPGFYLPEDFQKIFASDDERGLKWVTTTKYTPTGSTYLVPYKYKTGRGTAYTSSQYGEYHTLLRLAEVYLLRSEARLNANDLSGSRADLDVIRQRAGLIALPSILSYDQLKDSLMLERQRELFCEFGNRWMDLKRWHKSTEVLSLKTGVIWQQTDTLYPIPVQEIITNPNAYQNPGYN